ncbi:MAG: HAD family hydrolase [Solirubrobacteraceae bacterium]
MTGAPRGAPMCAADVKLVIFDCDGVLVDSEDISNGVLARMLTAEGLPTTLAQARDDYRGMTMAGVLAKAQSKLGRPLPDDWLGRFSGERADLFRQHLNPIAGAAEAVQRISEAGIAVCVASQGRLSKTRLSLALTGLDRFFPDDTRFSAELVPHGKPSPDLFLHAAETMGAPTASCVVVEDTTLGVQAAVAAGMHVFGYTADNDEQALLRAGAEILYSLEDLPCRLGLA